MTSMALIVGNSDGIGLATTRELLNQGWKVTGVSRSASPIDHPDYRHIKKEVQDPDYPDTLKLIVQKNQEIDLCLYCVGIGQLLDPLGMDTEVEVVAVNLLGMVKTAAEVIPPMVKRKKGHFIGLSSVADEMLSPEAPSYYASKTGFSSYLESLALALKPKGVAVTNIRFGFVDTKMAKGDVKPFMMSVEKAVGHVLKCIKKKPVRCIKEKGHDFCFECPSFPCQEADFEPMLKAKWLAANERMKETGAEAYYEEVKDRSHYS